MGETDTLLIDDVRIECGAGCLCGTECPTTTTTAEPVGDELR